MSVACANAPRASRTEGRRHTLLKACSEEINSLVRWQQGIAGLQMLSAQCLSFIVGSSLFALGTMPGPATLSAADARMLCFVGSWFFSIAAAIQLSLSTRSVGRSRGAPSLRADRLSTTIQLLGTLSFNLSTGASAWASRASARRDFAWRPDAFGSAAFLVSAALGVLAVGLAGVKLRVWVAALVNMLGSIAFGVSAVGAFVTNAGTTENAQLAQLGTFLGALCFLIAATLRLPKPGDAKPASPSDPPIDRRATEPS